MLGPQQFLLERPVTTGKHAVREGKNKLIEPFGIPAQQADRLTEAPSAFFMELEEHYPPFAEHLGHH